MECSKCKCSRNILTCIALTTPSCNLNVFMAKVKSNNLVETLKGSNLVMLLNLMSSIENYAYKFYIDLFIIESMLLCSPPPPEFIIVFLWIYWNHEQTKSEVAPHTENTQLMTDVNLKNASVHLWSYEDHKFSILFSYVIKYFWK